MSTLKSISLLAISLLKTARVSVTNSTGLQGIGVITRNEWSVQAVSPARAQSRAGIPNLLKVRTSCSSLVMCVAQCSMVFRSLRVSIISVCTSGSIVLACFRASFSRSADASAERTSADKGLRNSWLVLDPSVQMSIYYDAVSRTHISMNLSCVWRIFSASSARCSCKFCRFF